MGPCRREATVMSAAFVRAAAVGSRSEHWKWKVKRPLHWSQDDATASSFCFVRPFHINAPLIRLRYSFFSSKYSGTRVKGRPWEVVRVASWRRFIGVFKGPAVRFGNQQQSSALSSATNTTLEMNKVGFSYRVLPGFLLFCRIHRSLTFYLRYGSYTILRDSKRHFRFDLIAMQLTQRVWFVYFLMSRSLSWAC